VERSQRRKSRSRRTRPSIDTSISFVSIYSFHFLETYLPRTSGYGERDAMEADCGPDEHSAN
jgi:hypothetical protein